MPTQLLNLNLRVEVHRPDGAGMTTRHVSAFVLNEDPDDRAFVSTRTAERLLNDWNPDGWNWAPITEDPPTLGYVVSFFFFETINLFGNMLVDLGTLNRATEQSLSYGDDVGECSPRMQAYVEEFFGNKGMPYSSAATEAAKEMLCKMKREKVI